jgi:hypothetical protein
MKIDVFKTSKAVAMSGAMEQRPFEKRASLKSRMSKGKF